MEYVIVWMLLVMQPVQYDSVMGEVAWPLEFFYSTRAECRISMDITDIELDEGEYLVCLSTRLDYSEAE